MHDRLKAIPLPGGFTEAQALEAIDTIAAEDAAAWLLPAPEAALVANGQWFAEADGSFDRVQLGAPQFVLFAEWREELDAGLWDRVAPGHDSAVTPLTARLDPPDRAPVQTRPGDRIVRWKPEWAATWVAVTTTLHRVLSNGMGFWHGLLTR